MEDERMGGNGGRQPVFPCVPSKLACVRRRISIARATPSHAVLARARVQGGPLTPCGMATRRAQTSGRGRRAWPRDRARGGSQIRVVDPKPGTRTRGHAHPQHNIYIYRNELKKYETRDA